MKNPSPVQHPALNTAFNPENREPVWYLSHPLAPDDKYSFLTNMDHVEHMMRLCFDAGYRVIAPYHTICRVLDDNNAEHRRIGLEVDCRIAFLLGRIIMCGHKISRGMLEEHDAVYRRVQEWNDNHINNLGLQVGPADVVIDLTTMPDELAIEHLQYRKHRLNSGVKLG